MIYVESNLGYVNHFDLENGRLKIQSRVILGPSSELVLDLQQISPDYVKVRMRDPWITKWLIYAAVGGLVALVLWVLAEGSHILAYPLPLIYALLGGVVVLLVFALVHPWRYEAAVFLMRGGSPAFAIKKRGQMKEEYDAFISAVIDSAKGVADA